MKFETLRDTLQALISAFNQLESQLEGEKSCLSGRDLDDIGKIAQEKYLTCQKIRALENKIQEKIQGKVEGMSLPGKIAEFSESEQAKLEPLHTSLKAIATRCRDSNAVNGKIISRSQQCAKELIQLMSSANADPLYGHTGQTMAVTGQKIAKV